MSGSLIVLKWLPYFRASRADDSILEPQKSTILQLGKPSTTRKTFLEVLQPPHLTAVQHGEMSLVSQCLNVLTCAMEITTIFDSELL